MKIKPATQDDFPKLLDVFNSSRAQSGNFPQRIFSFDEFVEITKGEKILVARRAEEIAGFVSIWQPDNFIHHLFIAPHHQRKGIGRALVLESVHQFGLPLSLKCIKANTDACHFYERLGWREREEGVGPEGAYVLYQLVKGP